MRIVMLTAVLLLVLSAAVLAAPQTGGLADDAFVTQYFGTTAVFHTPRQIVLRSEQYWWGENLPPDMQSSTGYLTGIVNSRRMDRGVKPLLNPQDYSLIVPSAELPQDDGSYRYTVEFADMRPSEVEALIEVLGGLAKVLPGATAVSYEPLTRRSLSANSPTGGPLTLSLLGREISVPSGSGLAEVRAQLDGVLSAALGRTVPYDVTITQFSSMDGAQSFDLYVYVDMNYQPGDPSMSGGMEGEGGM